MKTKYHAKSNYPFSLSVYIHKKKLKKKVKRAEHPRIQAKDDKISCIHFATE
jgi:hypothetical protein